MAKSKSSAAQTSGGVVFNGIYKAFVRLLHFIAVVQFSYAIYYDFRYVEFPASETNMHAPFGGKFKYLTFLNAIIQALYYAISVLNDFIGTNELAPKKPPAVRRIKDYLFASLAFPVAINVSVTFWGLYAIDRELVFPRILDAVFPSWLNHIMHTNITIFIVVEMATTFREYPSRKKGLTGLIIFMVAYLSWIHVVKHYSGVWVYPVLEVLQLPQRFLFFAAVLSFTLCLYLLGESLNNHIWAKQLQGLQRRVKQH